ncbi:MAG TPA: zinc-ribbon domain-containing protein, partial [Minicystis sp.]|nr:zinc-ribbon domain-containing protein [Minicystis sp.]
MKITCQSCQSKYTVSDEKVQGKTVKIKCKKCGATIIVNSSGVSQSNGGTADPVSTSGGADGSYLVNVADGDQRTMNVQELVAAYHGGVVNADTYVWADGMADWQPIAQVDALVAALNEQAAPALAAAAPAYDAQPAAPAYAPEPTYA